MQSLQSNSSLEVTPASIIFTDTHTSQALSLLFLPHNNPNPCNFRLICSNPDNYLVTPQVGIIEPGHSVRVRITLKVYDAISSFNYTNNKLYLLYLSPAEQIQLQTIDIQVLLTMKSLDIEGANHLRKTVKIQRYSNEDINCKEFEMIIEHCQKIGNLKSLREFSGSLIVEFQQPVKIEPTLILKDNIIFTLCHLSSFMGTLRLFQVGKEREISHKVEQVKVFGTDIVCKTEDELVVYETLESVPVVHHHSEFSLVQFRPYKWVVIEKHRIYLYKDLNRAVKIPTHLIKVNGMVGEEGWLYVSFQRYVTIGATSVPAKRQQILTTKTFSQLPLDDSITVCQSEHCISILKCKKSLLFAYSYPVLYIFNRLNRALLSKIEKKLAGFDILSGVFATNFANAVGVDVDNNLCLFNFEFIDSYVGAEVVELEQQCIKACHCSQGFLHLLTRNAIIKYDLGSSTVKEEILLAQKDQQFIDMAINPNDAIILLKTRGKSKYLQIIKLH